MTTKLFRRHFIFKRLLLAAGLLFPWIGSRKVKAEEKQDSSPLMNETIQTINRLRTIHGNFTEEDIPEAKLQLILQSSVRAANASNMQTYSIVVVKDRNKMKQLCGYQGSCVLLYCVDHNRLIASAESLGHTYCPDNMNHFITASTNTILAVQTAAIAARSLGIDYLITNGIQRGDMKRIWDIVKLPQTHCYPLIAVVLGYPTKEPAQKKGRLNGTGVIHHEEYHSLTNDETAEITRQYDDSTQHLALIDNWKDQGHPHYLDWLFTRWLKRNSQPTERETQMFTLLKRSGYVDLQKS